MSSSPTALEDELFEEKPVTAGKKSAPEEESGQPAQPAAGQAPASSEPGTAKQPAGEPAKESPEQPPEEPAEPEEPALEISYGWSGEEYVIIYTRSEDVLENKSELESRVDHLDPPSPYPQGEVYGLDLELDGARDTRRNYSISLPSHLPDLDD